MSNTVQGAIEAIQDIALTVTGIRSAPDYAPDKLPALPAVVTYPARGNVTSMGGNSSQDFHTIYCEVHVQRKDLARDIKTLVPFIDSFRNELAGAPTLNDAVTTINYPITYEILEREFGSGNKTLVLRFIVEIKQLNVLT